jgi:predicted ABC-type ATPase
MAESTIYVFAGVNGSGKSSILGEFIRAQGGEFFNPDAYTRGLMESRQGLSLKEAQSQAWSFGRDCVSKAINEGNRFAFETTLGGNTISRILLNAAQGGTKVSVYYIGLDSVELNIQRVAERVAGGGRDIDEDKIRKRWHGSRQNVIRLLPYLNELLVYDNSETVVPGASPKPKLLIRISEGILHGGFDALFNEFFPEWAQPIAMAAHNCFREAN